MDPKKDATIALREEEFSVSRDDGPMPVFSVGPDNNDRLPGLIVIHEIFGLDDHIKDVARRFARHGLRVYAPDLFTRSRLWTKQESERTNLDLMRQIWTSIPDADLMADLDALFNKISLQENINGKVGMIGYCMGGAISLMFGGHEPKLAFVIDYYGRIKYGDTSKTKPKHPIDYIVPLKAPVLGVFAGKDELITKEHLAHFEQQMQNLGKTYQLKIYDDAQHAFFNDKRPFYNREASEDAWQLTLAFIKQHSKAQLSV